MIFFLQHQAHQFMNQWRNGHDSRESNGKCKSPCSQPYANNITDKPDIKHTDDEGHDAGHEQRHKK